MEKSLMPAVKAFYAEPAVLTATARGELPSHNALMQRVGSREVLGNVPEGQRKEFCDQTVRATIESNEGLTRRTSSWEEEKRRMEEDELYNRDVVIQ